MSIYLGAFLIVGLLNVEGGYVKAHEIPAVTYHCSPEGAKKGRCVYMCTAATLLVCCTALSMGLISMLKQVDRFQVTSRRKSRKDEFRYKTKLTDPSDAQREGVINFVITESKTIL